MAYKVSQLRKEDSRPYMQNISSDFEETVAISENPFGQENRTFNDFALQYQNQTFSKAQTYYLRFAIHQIPEYFYSGDNTLGYISPNYNPDADVLQLTVLLSNAIPAYNKEEHRQQIIGYCNIPKATRTPFDEDNSDNYSQYTMVFTPVIDNTYNQIVFKISRNTYDAIEKQQIGNNQKGRGRDWLVSQYVDRNSLNRLNITKTTTTAIGSSQIIESTTEGRRIIWNQVEELADGESPSLWKTGITGQISILNDLVPSSTSWLKIGYQSRPGNLIVVNRQPIRVGRSGIFELNNGIEIKNFMITSPLGFRTQKIDPFLLDYAYNS